MRIRTAHLAPLAALLVAAPDAAAQADSAVSRLATVELPKGTLVRFRAPRLARPRLTGEFRELRADTLVVSRTHGFNIVRVPVSELTELDRAVGSAPTRPYAAAAGGMVGGSVGGFIGLMASAVLSSNARTEEPARPLALTPIVSGALIGVTLGALQGWDMGPRRWVPVRPR